MNPVDGLFQRNKENLRRHFRLSAMPTFPWNTEISIAKFSRKPLQTLMTFSQLTSICTLFTGGNFCLGHFKVHISIRMITSLSSCGNTLDQLAGTLKKSHCLNLTLQTERHQETSQINDSQNQVML